jgi:vacuolar iron transporter family protein
MTPDGSKSKGKNDFEIHHTHRDVSGGWLRPAVFGASDGLVSNLALIAGVAGGTSAAGASVNAVLLAGLAGLAAGAFSMAAGEYVSVASQKELALAEIDLERTEIETRPHAEQRELAEMYRQRGVDSDLADEVAEQLSRDSDAALEVHVREELGLDPDDLPSPLLAAVSSFFSFSIGALIPLIPYFAGVANLVPSLLLSLAALFILGALVSQVTVRTWWYSGTRQLVLGGGAAAITWVIGTLVGEGLS